MTDSSALIEQYSNSFSNLSESFIGKDIEWVKESREKAFKHKAREVVEKFLNNLEKEFKIEQEIKMLGWQITSLISKK